ncbi:unnamed protein product, partial [Boreogadus saida]
MFITCSILGSLHKNKTLSVNILIFSTWFQMADRLEAGCTVSCLDSTGSMDMICGCLCRFKHFIKEHPNPNTSRLVCLYDDSK